MSDARKRPKRRTTIHDQAAAAPISKAVLLGIESSLRELLVAQGVSPTCLDHTLSAVLSAMTAFMALAERAGDGDEVASAISNGIDAIATLAELAGKNDAISDREPRHDA